MPARAPVKQAKELIKQNRAEQARALLLKHGFIQATDAAAQKAFFDLLPPSEQLARQLAGPLKQLRDSSAAARLKAARALYNEARKETSTKRAAWMADPRTTAPLIAALTDEDPRVAEEAAGALAEIIIRYFPDQRAFPALARALRHPRKEMRLNAARSISLLRHKDRWQVLLPLLADKTADVRQEVCMVVTDAAMRGDLSARERRELRPAMLRALQDKDSEVRLLAANALREIGDPSITADLQRALAQEKNREVRADLARALAVSRGEPDPLLA